MLHLLVLWCLTIYCSGSPTSAHEATGILPGAVPVSRPRDDEAAATRLSGGGLPVEEPVGGVHVSVGSRNRNKRGRYSPMLVLHDLLHARRSSRDGLLQLQYPAYLTHALLLSSAEATAYDLQRAPLHRFTSALSADQIAEVRLTGVGGSRAFHMFVLFTFIEGRTDAVAEQLSSQCADCSNALGAFRKASKAYKLSDSSPANEDALPVFFAVVNVGTRDGAAISAIHPAMQLPIVVHLPPTTGRYAAFGNSAPGSNETPGPFATDGISAMNSLKAARLRIAAAEFFAKTIEDEQDEDTQLRQLLLQQQKDGVHGKVHFFSLPQHHFLLLQRRKNEASLDQRLLQWANTRTNREVNYVEKADSLEAQARRNGLLAVLPLLVALLCWLAWKGISLLRRNQWIIPTGGVVVYTLCSGGLVFSIIHSVPFAGYDAGNRRYALLAPSTRAQYMIEGILLSFCSTVASLAALGLVRVHRAARTAPCDSPTCIDEANSTDEDRAQKNDAVVESAGRQMSCREYFMVLLFSVLAVLMVFCSGLVMECYRTKAAWYAPTFWPGAHLPKGPLKVDWGIMF